MQEGGYLHHVKIMVRRFIATVKFVWYCILLCRNGDHTPEDIIPACELTLKNLQLEYLDLYLMHWPLAQKKGVPLAELTEEERVGYDEEGIAITWKVRRIGEIKWAELNSVQCLGG